MIVVNNPFGQEFVDFNEETSADRVGGRIRKIRRARNLSQSELGKSVGLSADRIQKYENGVRRPKMDMMKKIADALDVDALALTDPVVSNYIGAMYAFFEMEDLYELRVQDDGRISLSFDNGITGSMNSYLREWQKMREWRDGAWEKAESEREREAIQEKYNTWKWTFPKALADRTDKRMRKLQIKNRIEQLQEELLSLEESE